MKKFNENEQAALEELYKLHFRPLVGFANSYLKDEEESKTVVTDIFIEFWNKGKLSEAHKNIRSYFMTATRYACLKVLKQRKHLTENLSTVSMKAEESGMNEQARYHVVQIAYEAIEKLPEACREISKLSFLQGFSNEEIASQKNLSVHTVKNQKVRAVKLIRAYLESKGLSDSTIYIYLMVILLQSSPGFSQN